jgi:hypothetical protein
MGVGANAADAAHKDTVDLNTWAIVDGKLYLTHTTRSLDMWRQNAAANINRAGENWSTVKTQDEPAIVGPPSAITRPRL